MWFTQSTCHPRVSPAHLSGAATPIQEQPRIMGSVGPPYLTSSPQGPGSGNLPVFQGPSQTQPPREPRSASLSLSPQQRGRQVAVLKHAVLHQQHLHTQQHHAQQHHMFAGAPNIRVKEDLNSPGPGPGPFGRGTSPLDGHVVHTDTHIHTHTYTRKKTHA